MAKSMGPFRYSRASSWLSGPRTDLPAEPPLICRAHYITDQSMISICDMKKMLGDEAEQIPLDSTYTTMLIHYMYLITINRIRSEI
jgi:hypothetical protein